jgi:hypothetical protein
VRASVRAPRARVRRRCLCGRFGAPTVCADSAKTEVFSRYLLIGWYDRFKMDYLFPLAFFLVPFLEAVAVLYLTGKRRQQLLIDLRRLAPSTEIDIVPIDDETELSATEVAMLASRGDDVHLMEVLAVDLMHRINKGDEDSVSDEERALLESIKFRLDNPELPRFLSPGWRVLTLSSLDFIFGKSIQKFVGRYILDSDRHVKSMSYARIAQIADEHAYDNAFRDLKKAVRRRMESRGLIVPEDKLFEMQEKFNKISGRPIMLTSAIILFTVFAYGMFMIGSSASGFLATVVGVVTMTLYVGLVYVIWVATAAIPAALINALLKAETFIPGWIPLSWAGSEVPLRDMRTKLIRFCVPFAGLIRPFIVSMILIIAGYFVVIAMATPGWLALGPVLCTFAAITGWIMSFKIRDDIRSIKSLVVPTELGEKRLKDIKRKFSESSPILSLGNSLNKEHYDPAFSQLVAVQGTEILWLLSDTRQDKTTD